MNTAEALIDRIDSDIERVGWSAIGVMPTVDDEDPGPPFTYSIGFYNYNGHPEVIVVGLDPHVAHTIIYGLFERVRNGERFQDGQLDSDVLEGYDVRFRALPPEGRPANIARTYFEVDELPVLQVLWPDANGRFPDEEGFEERYVGAQDIRGEDL